tara:strand:+ start:358 stop:882 length:525 start_codon:yes stop_codon:yes gene_type:complete
MLPNIKKQFESIYNDLVKYADKQYKRNVDSIDLVNDLYIYLNNNPSKADSSTLLAFCYSYIYNQSRYTVIDKKNRYSNANTTSIESFYYLEDEVEEVAELSTKACMKLSKVAEAKCNMNSRMLKVYELYYEQNYRYTEIVEMTGISLGDVYNRIEEIKEFINTYVEDRQQLRII